MGHPSKHFFYFPIELEHLLVRHVEELGTNISSLARELLLQDMIKKFNNSPERVHHLENGMVHVDPVIFSPDDIEQLFKVSAPFDRTRKI